jgi:hypothetical protein
LFEHPGFNTTATVSPLLCLEAAEWLQLAASAALLLLLLLPD